ncbi:hypothetical protein RJ640_022552 [Escallonia rubra]|uniref:Uncharacterized protein n=1 Tax=Escallonia rubra TaxID=112253 RepID=A0AA88RUU8_9ASTE|nr:hypothetical protein RJ640_022552 [Escallonia rubra]
MGKTYSIQLVELHLPTIPNLPPHYHTTNGLPPNLMPTLKKAFQMVNSNFAKILKTLEPDLLIYDILQPWAPKIALEHNIPGVLFITSSAAVNAYGLDIYKNPGIGFPFPEIYNRHYGNVLVAGMHESAGVDDNEEIPVNEPMEQSSKIVLINTFKEIEGKYCDYLSKLGGKKILTAYTLTKATHCPSRQRHHTRPHHYHRQPIPQNKRRPGHFTADKSHPPPVAATPPYPATSLPSATNPAKTNADRSRKSGHITAANSHPPPSPQPDYPATDPTTTNPANHTRKVDRRIRIGKRKIPLN